MPIEYKMIQLSNKLKSNVHSKYYPCAVSKRNVTIRDIALRLSTSSSVTMSDVRGVYIGLLECIKNSLLEGNTVSLDELGTFSIIPGARLVDTPDEIRAASLHVKGIAFKPSPVFMTSMKQAKFVRSTKE